MSATDVNVAPDSLVRRLSSPDVMRVLPIVAVVCLSLVVMVLTANPILAVMLVIAAVAVWVVLVAPMRWTLMALVVAAIFGDVTPWDPRTGQLWVSAASVPQYFLLENLNKISGIGALRFSGMELILVALTLLSGLRFLARYSLDRNGRVPIPGPLLVTIALSFAAVVLLIGFGAARGGDVRQAFWQFRYLLWLPLMTILMHYALRDVRDGKLVLGAITFIASAKVVLAAYFVFRVARPAGETPAHVTSHADTVLWIAVLAVWAAIAIERPTRRRIAMTLLVWGWTVFGIVLNNRRTAVVSLLASLLLLFFTLSARAKRRLMTGALALLPITIPYLIVGRRRSTGIFTPAAQFWSVFYQKDSSSATRDIENYNLIATIRKDVVFGSGWGHEYIELIHAYDIQTIFAQYRYIAHNSVLWLLSIGGFVGVSLLWMPLVAAIYLAARSKRYADSAIERVTAYSIVAVITCYLLQAWSDMGVMGWTATSMVSIAIAMSGKLATETGAWPNAAYAAAHPRSPAASDASVTS